MGRVAGMSLTELSKLNHSKHLAMWQQQVYGCRNSGTTVKAWCAQNGVTEKSYYYRQRKVWEAAQQKTLNRETLVQGSVKIPSCRPLFFVPLLLCQCNTIRPATLRPLPWSCGESPGQWKLPPIVIHNCYAR